MAERARSLIPRATWLQITVICVVVFVVYIPSLSVPWYFDDYFAIVDNWSLRSLAGIKYNLRNFIHRSIVQLSYTLDWQVSHYLDLYQTRTVAGEPGYQKPVIYHLSSVIYHLVVVVGVFLLVRKLIRLIHVDPGRQVTLGVFVPGLVALLYGLLPINTEGVTYLSGRSSVLATAEYVFGMLCFFVAAERFGLLEKRLHRRRASDYVLGLCALLGMGLFFVLGIGTKEIIVTMPVVAILVLGLLIGCRVSARAALVRLTPVCLLAGFLLVGFFIYRVHALASNPAAGSSGAETVWPGVVMRAIGIPDARIRPWDVNLLSQVGVVALYYIPRQLCLRPLCIDPQVPLIGKVTHPRFLAGLLVLGGLLAVTVVCIRKAPLVTIGLIWYFVALAPTSSVIPLNDLASERHTYLPNVGFVLAVVAGGETVRLFLERRGLSPAKMAKVLGVMILSICVLESYWTIQRNRLYGDKIKFWEDAARQSPGKFRVHHHLAKEYWMAGRPRDAVAAYRAALEIHPDPAAPINMDAANNMGLILMKDLKQYDQAARVFEQCIAFWPDWDNPWINLGTCYLLADKFDKANDVARRWLERKPDSVDARVLMANSLYKQGLLDDAEASYLEVLRMDRDNLTALENLASIARTKGELAAAKAYEKRLEILRKKQGFRPIEVAGKRDTIKADRFVREPPG